MSEQTPFNKLIVRLRREGGGLVMSLPVAVREELQLTAGDVMVISSEPPHLIATKIDISRALADIAKTRRRDGH